MRLLGSMGDGGRQRGMPPPRDFLSNTHLARGIGNQKQYDWLRPCETLQHVKEYEGPLRRMREAMVRPCPSYPKAQLPPVVSDWQRQAGGAHGSGARVKPSHRPKVYNTDIWPVGSQGPRWRPLSPGEKAHRHNANAAVQAASAMQQGKSLTRSASVPGRRPRRYTRDAPVVESTPGIEAWDSVSQAPSSPRSLRLPCPGGGGGGYWEVMSAETATATEGPRAFPSQDDADIARHLARNRHGWYDHCNGRFIG